ncbi:hypothetical protein [Brachybacterium tyrofermentans]|uniref:hypothetical protein n=1 Tax=Brachybacterium tyrofermentans TaxID=47848 RepID=UPI003FD3BDD5
MEHEAAEHGDGNYVGRCSLGPRLRDHQTRQFRSGFCIGIDAAVDETAASEDLWWLDDGSAMCLATADEGVEMVELHAPWG